MSTPQHRNAVREFSLFAALYVVLGVPACTAIVLFVVGVFVTFLLNGASFDLAGMEFWTAVAFFMGPLTIVGIALRAWRRVRHGAPSFLHPGLTRLVPVFIGVGVFGALVLGGVARARYVETLENEADNFCFTYSNSRAFSSEAECEDVARECLRARPIDEQPHSNGRRFRLGACMDEWVQAAQQP